jgi:hypothetical protein
MRSVLGRLFLGVFGFGLFLLAGCGSSGSSASSQPSSPAPLSDADIFGTVYGGEQVVAGAHVYLLAANTTGYGNASVSLLSAAETGTSDSVGAYVLTTVNGDFTLKGLYTCTTGQQIYLYVLGGDASTGSANPALGLMTAIGYCPASSGPGVGVYVNEVTTVAAAYALAGYATDAVHVSSSGTALAKTGVANAFANAGSLVPSATGVTPDCVPSSTCDSQPGTKTATVPQAEINTLGNILAGCVQSAAACNGLFSLATSDGTATGTKPIDTATAAINIAHHPGANVAALFGMRNTGAFSPQLGAAPNDFTLALSFAGGGILGPTAVAIDGSGNAWVTNADFLTAAGASVTEIASYGVFVTGAGGFTNAAIVNPEGVAVDDSGDAWIASASTASANEINSGDSLLQPPHGYATAGSNAGVAIDGLGNSWFAGGAIREYNSSGAAVAANPYSGGGLSTNNAIAIDGAGSAWIPNPTGTVTKLSSAGAALSGTSGYAASACCGSALGIAIDGSGDAWMTSRPGVVELSNAGAVLSGANGFTGGGLGAPTGIAIDGAGKVWVVNGTGGADLAELSSTGAVLTGANGYQSVNMTDPVGLAIDGSGDVWVANEGVQNSSSGNVLEFMGVATPVVTPIAAGLPATPTANGSSNLGTRP